MESEKVSLFSKLPKWIRIVLIFISVVTLVWWVGFCIYWILEAIRRVLNLITDKKYWWIFIICVVACVIICLLFAQFYFKLNPFGKSIQWFIDIFNELRGNIAKAIGGK